MQRLMMGVAFFSILISAGRAEDVPAQKKSSLYDDAPATTASPFYEQLKRELATAQGRHAKALKEAQNAVDNATTDDDKVELQKTLDFVKDDLPGPKYADLFLKFARQHPEDSMAFPAAMMAFNIGRAPTTRENTRGKVLVFLQETYAAKPQIKRIVRHLESNKSPAAEPLLKEVLAKNPDRRIQGHACKALLGITTKAAEKDRLNKLMTGKYADLFPDLSIGKTVPEIVARDVHGKEVKLSALKGKVVVLDFWATWCPYCRAMIPHQREMVDRLKNKPFALVGLCVDVKKETLTKFLEKEDLPWDQWWVGANNDLQDAWNIEFFPTVYVIDANGVIRNEGLAGQELDEAVNGLLKKLEKNKK